MEGGGRGGIRVWRVEGGGLSVESEGSTADIVDDGGLKVRRVEGSGCGG